MSSLIENAEKWHNVQPMKSYMIHIDKYDHNCTSVSLGEDFQVYFSYRTPVAFRNTDREMIVVENNMGEVTAKHLKAIAYARPHKIYTVKAFKLAIRKAFRKAVAVMAQKIAMETLTGQQDNDIEIEEMNLCQQQLRQMEQHPLPFRY